MDLRPPRGAPNAGDPPEKERQMNSMLPVLLGASAALISLVVLPRLPLWRLPWVARVSLPYIVFLAAAILWDLDQRYLYAASSFLTVWLLGCAYTCLRRRFGRR